MRRSSATLNVESGSKAGEGSMVLGNSASARIAAGSSVLLGCWSQAMRLRPISHVSATCKSVVKSKIHSLPLHVTTSTFSVLDDSAVSLSDLPLSYPHCVFQSRAFPPTIEDVSGAATTQIPLLDG